MLEQIGVDVAAVHDFVQCHPIRQLDDLDVLPLLLGELGGKGRQLANGAGAGRDLQRFAGEGGRRECEPEAGGLDGTTKDFHHLKSRCNSDDPSHAALRAPASACASA